MAKALLVGGTLLVALLPAAATISLADTAELPAHITGSADIVSGDTLAIADQKIRLWGIEAPDLEQMCHDQKGEVWPCGQESRRALMALIDNRDIVCEPLDYDEPERLVARCNRNGVDLARWLVRNGWAMSGSASNEGYALEQEKAQTSHAGIWQGELAPPE